MANSRRNSENTEYNVLGPAEHSNQEATNHNTNAVNQEQLLAEFQDNLAKINGKAALEWENRKDVGIEPLEATTEYTKDEIRALRDLNFTDAEKSSSRRTGQGRNSPPNSNSSITWQQKAGSTGSSPTRNWKRSAPPPTLRSSSSATSKPPPPAPPTK